MRFINIMLSGYIRLELNHINYIELDFVNKIQLILGTNGSGKSSLMKELTPLPANHKEYKSGGYKIVELTHNNAHYVLKSMFHATGHKYHFIKDGEEQNTGGTQTSYRDLVRKEFKITQDVHDILIGVTNFTTMSIADRRVWFTKISDTDYTYAISYYKKLSMLLRESELGVKMTHAQLVQENEKLLKPEQEKIYRDEIVMFNDMLSYLLDLKPSSRHTKEQLQQDLARDEQQLTALTNTMREYRSQFVKKSIFKDKDDIDSAIIDVQADIQGHERFVQTLYAAMEEQEKTLTALRESNIDSNAGIDEVIDRLSVEINTTRSKIHYPFIDQFQSPKEADQALSSVADSLMDILGRLEANPSRESYNREIYAAKTEQVNLLQVCISAKETRMQDLTIRKKELEHFKAHKQVECPNCQHVWHQGYNEGTYQDTIAQIARFGHEIAADNVTLLEVQKVVEGQREYLELFRQYRAVTQSWQILNPLWEFLAGFVLFIEPQKIGQVLNNLRVDLQLAMQVVEFQREFAETIKLKVMLSQNQETNVAAIIAKGEKDSRDVFEWNRVIASRKVWLSRLQMYKKVAVEVERLAAAISTTIEERSGKAQALVDINRIESINETIRLVKLELSQREQTISKIDVQKAVIANLEKQLTEYTAKTEVLKIAVAELSPTKGLIARGLTGFINHFTAQMNSFIKKIWLYPLELIPVIPDDDDSVELDYKFMVLVNETSKIPDIARCSAGMKEVINLGFKVVSAVHLGLQESPIYLDEFAAAMDSAHRSQAHYTITNLLTSSNFSQIFMISHYENSYGSLKNADVTVLCDSNIGMSSDLAFNKHCTIR